MDAHPRDFDLIVWGATGYTGRLVAEYLMEQYGLDGALRWAVAGRNPEKLERLKQKLEAPDLPAVTADSLDKETLKAMVRRSRVVCSTVGPYAIYGSPLVEACVEEQTDYCDLTGEVQWMRKMIDQHHATAREQGVRIVHTCGFDSIPSDLGVYFLQEQSKTSAGAYCSQVKFRLKGAGGGFSGGTIASLRNVLVEAAADRSVRRVLADPYGLNPEGEREGQDGPDLQGVEFDPDFRSWIAPFVMASINTRVVRRSHALRGWPYGKDFRYDEATLTGGGFAGRLKAYLLLFFTGLLAAARPGTFLGNLFQRFLPKPGQGPTAQQREQGYFRILLSGRTPDGARLNAKISSDRDPGYGATSRMLAESAACLALDREQTPDVGGVLTPASAMGSALLKRLRERAEVHFELIQ